MDYLSTYPNQPNKHIVIKENDNIEFCGRPSFYLKNGAVCLAYRINGDKTINVVNEWWHLSAGSDDLRCNVCRLVHDGLSVASNYYSARFDLLRCIFVLEF